jgi:hypothetical protein
VNNVNPLTHLTSVLSNVRGKRVTLLTPKKFAISKVDHKGGKLFFNNPGKADAGYHTGSFLRCPA